jgi:nitroreductase
MIVVCYWLPVTHNREAGQRRIVNVYEAVRSRRSVRSFVGRPVPAAALTRVLSAALLAPSGGNLQPWQVYLLSGSRLEDLKSRVRRRIAADDHGDALPVQPYPADLPAIYARRLADMGERRYGAAGIARYDRDGRARVRARNWECFGAPAALFCYLDERMHPPQWMDAGIFLQSVMLLLRAEGLHSCAQIAWAEYHCTVAEVTFLDSLSRKYVPHALARGPVRALVYRECRLAGFAIFMLAWLLLVVRCGHCRWMPGNRRGPYRAAALRLDHVPVADPPSGQRCRRATVCPTARYVRREAA